MPVQIWFQHSPKKASAATLQDINCLYLRVLN